MKIYRKLAQLFTMGLLVSSFSAYAGDYWVLGSYELQNNAFREADRLKNESGMDIKVVEYVRNGRVYNRLVVDKAAGETHEQISNSVGIYPWVLYENGRTPNASRYARAPVRESSRNRRSEMRMEDQPMMMASVSSSMAQANMNVNPPREGESLVEYCIQEANPRERELFCSDSMLGRVLDVSVN